MFSSQAWPRTFAISVMIQPSHGVPSMRSGLSRPVTHISAPVISSIYLSDSEMRLTHRAGTSFFRSRQKILVAWLCVGAPQKYRGSGKSLPTNARCTSMRLLSSVPPLRRPLARVMNRCGLVRKRCCSSWCAMGVQRTGKSNWRAGISGRRRAWRLRTTIASLCLPIAVLPVAVAGRLILLPRRLAGRTTGQVHHAAQLVLEGQRLLVRVA